MAKSVRIDENRTYCLQKSSLLLSLIRFMLLQLLVLCYLVIIIKFAVNGNSLDLFKLILISQVVSMFNLEVCANHYFG